jgi:hypothetical protein
LSFRTYFQRVVLADATMTTIDYQLRKFLRDPSTLLFLSNWAAEYMSQVFQRDDVKDSLTRVFPNCNALMKCRYLRLPQ